MQTEFDHTWYKPGNWVLPAWWTSGVPMRVGHTATKADQEYFYNGPFVRSVLGHIGGITSLPVTSSET